MPFFIDRCSFENVMMVNLYRERSLQRRIIGDAIPAGSTHSATCTRIQSTQIFTIQLRLVRHSNELFKPVEGTLVKITREGGMIYDCYVVADIPAVWDVTLLGLTDDTLATSSKGSENMQTHSTRPRSSWRCKTPLEVHRVFQAIRDECQDVQVAEGELHQHFYLPKKPIIVRMHALQTEKRIIERDAEAQRSNPKPAILQGRRKT